MSEAWNVGKYFSMEKMRKSVMEDSTGFRELNYSLSQVAMHPGK